MWYVFLCVVTPSIHDSDARLPDRRLFPVRFQVPRCLAKTGLICSNSVSTLAGDVIVYIQYMHYIVVFDESEGRPYLLNH